MEKWECSVCFYIHEDPLTEGCKCPVCAHPQACFEVHAESC